LKTYNELRSIDVSKFVEKKGGLSYLSWTYAVDMLLLSDPMATWDFLPFIVINETILVRVDVHALGKRITMQLACMDNRNNAVKNPDARKISDTQMRCLVKAIACFGIGLYVYAGEDLPPQEDNGPTDEECGQGFQANGYVVPFGNNKGRTIDEIAQNIGIDKLTKAIYLTEERLAEGKVYSGATVEDMMKFIFEAQNYVIAFENQDRL